MKVVIISCILRTLGIASNIEDNYKGFRIPYDVLRLDSIASTILFTCISVVRDGRVPKYLSYPNQGNPSMMTIYISANL